MARTESRDAGARQRFAGRTWDGLEPMMKDYAREAVTVAAADFHESLSSTPDGVERLERILNRLCPAPAPPATEDSEWWTLLWGGWFGECLRALHDGAWTMTVYPGSEFAVPTLEFPGGSRVYPTMKVHRRLTLGAAEGLPQFHAMLAERLSAGAHGL